MELKDLCPHLDTRVAETLARLAGTDRPANVKLTHGQLADLVGSSRETTGGYSSGPRK